MLMRHTYHAYSCDTQEFLGEGYVVAPAEAPLQELLELAECFGGYPEFAEVTPAHEGDTYGQTWCYPY